MKNKFIAVVASFCLLNTTGFAAEIKNCDISAEGVITLESSLDSKKEGALVSLKVLRPGVSVEDLQENVEIADKVAEFSRAESEKDGKVIFTFAIDGQSDFYECFIASDAGDEQSFRILYSNPAEAKDIILKLNNATSDEEFYSLIYGEDDGYKALGFYLSTPENADDRKVSDLLYSYVNNVSKLDENNTEKAADIFKKFYVIQLLNEKKKISVGEFEKYLDIDSYGWYGYYEKNYITEAVKTDIFSGAMGKNLKNEDDFEKALFEQLVLKTVRYSDGYGNIRDILTEYESYTGIKTGTLTRENYNQVLGKSYDDYGALEEGLRGKTSSKPQGGSGSGGTGSKNNSPIGSTTVSLSGVTSDNKKPEQIYYGDAEESVFEDIRDIDWAKEAIVKLYDKGIVNGKADTIFAPNDSITREEFVAILVRALGYDEKSSDIVFSDVDPDAWYSDVIGAAVLKGIVIGKEDGSFGIGENITRQDIAVMLYRALNLSGGIDLSDTFSDDSEISDYAKNPVYTLRSKEIFSGFSDGSFKPKDYATRAQAAVVIYRAFSDKL